MILEKIREILVKELGIDGDKVTMDADIVKDIGADSLDIVELLMDVESEWGIEIDDEIVTRFRTVGDVVKYIEETVR